MVTVNGSGCRAPRLRPEMFQLCWEQQGQGGGGGGNHPEQPCTVCCMLVLHFPHISLSLWVKFQEKLGEQQQPRSPWAVLWDSEGMTDIPTPFLSTIPIPFSAALVAPDPRPYLPSFSPFPEPLGYHFGANLPLDLTLTNVPSTHL